MANNSYEKSPEFKLLLHGLDTVECAYYLLPTTRNKLENILEPLKEKILSSKKRKCETVTLSGVEFLLFQSGTASGYTYQLKNSAYHIQFGGKNNPNFFVTFSSEALWHYGVYQLHDTFLQFALSIGYREEKPEGISRIDHASDYHAQVIDFDRKDFASQARLGDLHWNGDVDETISMGTTPIRLRVYDKVAEIFNQSEKYWFFKLWGIYEDVWRIEWQARKGVLRDFGIRTFEDLRRFQGDLLHYLAHTHTTLRIKSGDSNKSRRAIHPLWKHHQEFTENLPREGVLRFHDKNIVIDRSISCINKSIYGYLKRLSALQAIKNERTSIPLLETIEGLSLGINEFHEEPEWLSLVKQKIAEIKAGKYK